MANYSVEATAYVGDGLKKSRVFEEAVKHYIGEVVILENSIMGTIEEIHPFFALVQLKNYKMCVMWQDFIRGEVQYA